MSVSFTQLRQTIDLAEKVKIDSGEKIVKTEKVGRKKNIEVTITTKGGKFFVYFDSEKYAGSYRDEKAADQIVKDYLKLVGEELEENRAKRDALRAMGRRKGRDAADIDDTATDDDVKSADKNIMVQLRKVVSLRGMKPVEFADGKKAKINPKDAEKMLSIYDTLKPASKMQLQTVLARSKSEFDKAVKQLKVNEYFDSDLDEGVLSDKWRKGAKSVKIGKFELVRGNSGVHKILKDRKPFGDLSLDDEAGMWVGNMKGMKGQWLGREIDDLFTHLKKAHEELDEAKEVLSRFRDDKLKQTIINLAKQKGLKVKDMGDKIEVSGNGRKVMDLTLAVQKQDVKIEELEEGKSSTGYELYHKDFSTAMKHAYDFAKRKFKIDVDPKEIDDKVASGPRKPSAGKTNSYRLLDKDGKRAIQVQVYNMDNKKYELNMYKEEVELTESPMVSFTVPNVTFDMAQKLERVAKEKGIEYSRKGRTFVLKGKRIDMTMLRTKMGLAQTNIPMVPVKEEVELDEVKQPTKKEIMKVIGHTKNAIQGREALRKKYGVSDKEADDMIHKAMTEEVELDEAPKMRYALVGTDMKIYSMGSDERDLRLDRRSLEKRFKDVAPLKMARLKTAQAIGDKVDKSQLKEEEELEEKYTAKQYKMAFGVLNDPRWKGGNMTRIVTTIEKIAKGLSKDKAVAKAIQLTNESLAERELTPAELEKREKIAKDLPDAEFKKRYGDKWMNVKMATATNIAKGED